MSVASISIIALGFGIAAATAILILVGRPAFDRLHRWLDWRHVARMQVRRKLAIHRSLWARAAATTADGHPPRHASELECADRSE